MSLPHFKNPQLLDTVSASLNDNQNLQDFKFERPDWTEFRSIGGLAKKAGVPSKQLRRLVLKELADNALDTGGSVSIEQVGDTYIISDDGPGIAGDPEDIARLFSIGRPMVSSKLWRLPKRGALGNGLRVVAGAVLASTGTLVVSTRNCRHMLTPMDDGTTAVTSAPIVFPVGTRIEISFGSEMPSDGNATAWADLAASMTGAESYTGKSSPYWYDADHFFELLQAAGSMSVRELISQLDGCTGARAGQIAAAFLGMGCSDLDRAQAVALLGAARSHAKPVSAKRLGYIGKSDSAYAIETGTAEIGARNPKASIPFTIEAWVEVADQGPIATADGVTLTVLVNRTPITGNVQAYKEKRTIILRGCGLFHRFEAERGCYDITFNVTTPHCPITNDGKEPDLTPFVNQIADAIKGAIKRAKRAIPKAPTKRSHKAIVLENLDYAIAKNSEGVPTFNLRNLYYVIRTIVSEELGSELTYGNFENIITGYEEDNGDIAGLTRDPRGTLYHPHTGESIPVGTKTVSEYQRPSWGFNKVLFIEKEGFFEPLKNAKWPERYDCALLTSKGYSTRAVRDLIDLLADGADEPLTVFCVHDGDAFGTMIMQTIQEATRARGRRRIEIINLGLDPWEALEMGLAEESRDKDSKPAAVADYVKDRSDGKYWEGWLQKNRYELNAMTMPQFIAWLDQKMADHGVTKVLPPAEHVHDDIRWRTSRLVREGIETRILNDAGIDDLLDDAMSEIEFPDQDEITTGLLTYLNEHPVESWRGWTNKTAAALATM